MNNSMMNQNMMNQNMMNQNMMNNNMMSNYSNGYNIMEPAADISRAYLTVSFWVSVVIGLCMVISGIFVISTKSTHSENVKGKVLDRHCSTVISRRSYSSRQSCDIVVEYEYNNQKYQSNVRANRLYPVGADINLFINPKNPISVTTTSPSSKRTIGICLICCAIIIVLLSYFIMKMAQKSDTFAIGASIFSVAN